MHEKVLLLRIQREKVMLEGVRFFSKQGDSFSKVLLVRSGVRHCGVSSQNKANVVIPPRIERKPTDILKALASTVGVDHTAFHYKYPDDPFFYSYSSEKKKVLGLSLESGRRSAKWIFENNPAFFKHQLSQPPIEKFLVKPINVSESEPTEKTLLQAIEERNVLRAIEVYKALEKRNCDVSEFTKQSLLELTCFYNNKEKSDKGLEEKWFLEETYETKIVDQWMNNGFAEKLFEKMDSNCSLANSAIIQGMLKYDEVAKAQEIFEGARVKKVKFPVGVYNMYLSKIYKLSEGKAVINHIEKILKEMSNAKIKPNIGTLNASLNSLVRSKISGENISFTLKLMAEFERLGIEPSLGSYGLLFRILSFNEFFRNRYHELVSECMNRIEKKKFEILHPTDFKFFTNALFAFSKFDDPDLTWQLLNMYSLNNNFKFIINDKDETTFFKKSSLNIFGKKPVEFTMDVYRRYFFTSYSPNMEVLLALISTVARHHTPEYLHEIWNDIKETPLQNQEALMHLILSFVMDFCDEASQKLFHAVAISYLTFLRGKEYFCSREASRSISDILITFVKNRDTERVLEVLNNLKEAVLLNSNRDTMEALFNYGLTEQNTFILSESLNIAAERNLSSVSEMASKALPFLTGHSKTRAIELINRKSEEEEKKPQN